MTENNKHNTMNMIASLCLAIIFTFHLTCPPILSAQDTIDSSLYYWGESIGNDLDETKRAALTDMVNKISVSVSQETHDVTDVTEENGQVTTKSKTNISTVTRSELTSLQNIEYQLLNDCPPYRVICYVSRANIQKLFEQRKERAFQMLRDANRALERTKIDDAIRQYYWALALICNVPGSSSIHIDDDNSKPLMTSWIPNQIKDIISDIRVTEVKHGENLVILKFTYNEKVIRSLEFSYFDGIQTSPSIIAKDGIAQIDINPKSDLESFSFKIEYQFKPQALIDSELKSIIENSPQIPNTAIRLSKNIATESPTEVDIESPESNISQLLVSDDIYDKAISSIINAIKKNQYTGITQLFTPEGWTMITQLLQYGKARLIGSPEYKFYRVNDGRVCCRSIKMSFSFPNNKKQFTEDVTFTFNRDKKIECVAFGLGESARTDIFDKSIGALGDEAKIILATFLENYKTAYALKRIDYIESIFDDNAIIIVGSVVKQAPKIDENNWHIEEKVKYYQYSKAEYIERLKRVFSKNEFVNINFADNRITKMRGSRYAIQIHQDYYSSSYSDTGFLFLLVNIDNIDEPSISLRIWQAERDPENINKYLPKDDPDYGIFSPGEF